MFKIKKSIIILFAIIFLPEFLDANINVNNRIIIDISEQRLYLYEKDILKQSFPVSTSSFGEGSLENSFKTPLGSHEIKQKKRFDIVILSVAHDVFSKINPIKLLNKKL